MSTSTDGIESPTLDSPADQAKSQAKLMAASSVLQSALVGMDLNLTEELDRYSYWRANGQTFSYLKPYTRDISTEKPNLEFLPQVTPPIQAVRQSANQSLGQSVEDFDNHAANPIAPEPQVADTNDSAIANLSSDPKSSPGAVTPTSLSLSQSNPYTALSEKIDQIDQFEHVKESLPSASPDQTSKPRGFGGGGISSTLGIIFLILLCFGSAILGYLFMDSVGLNKLLQRDRSPQEPPNLTPSPQSQIPDPALRLGQPDDIARTSMPTLTPFTKQPETKNPNYANNLSQVTAFPSVAMPKFATPSLASTPSIKPPAPKAPAVSVRPLLSSRSETAFKRLPAPSANLGNPPPIMSSPPLEPEQPRISPPAYTSRKSEPRRIEPSRMEVNESITSAAKLQLPPSRKSWAAKTIATPAPTAPFPDLSVKYAPAVSQNLVVDNKNASNKHYAIVAPTRYLAEGRQVEKEAFIRSKDGQIQLGSFRDADSAQRRIDELRQQGIPVDAIKVEAK